MSGASPIQIAERTQKSAAHPAKSVWVSASAGSGKTKVLTDRVLALLLTGTAPHKILCLTFTKAAAAEMSNRINERLASWVTMDEDTLWNQLAALHPDTPDRLLLDRARRLFAQVLDAPGGLSISTIHGFCQSLLKRFPLEAGVTPHFTVMDERDAREALAMAQEQCIAHAHRGDDAALAEALKLITARVHETHFADLMDSLAGCRTKLARMFEAHGGFANVAKALRRKLGLSEDATEGSLLAEACLDTSFEYEGLISAGTAMSGGSSADQKRAIELRSWLTEKHTRASRFDHYTEFYLTSKFEIRVTLATQKVEKSSPGTLDVLQREAVRVLDILEKCRAARVAANTEALLRLGARMLDIYGAEKSRRGLLDYDDLIQTARRLVERDGAAAWVLYKLDGGLDHILIDEAQDTNPDQWAIVDALTREFFAGEGAHEQVSVNPRTVFAVGDRKQSIYGFQGAAPDEFDRMQKVLEGRATAANQAWGSEDLFVSFRSTRAVLDAVDHVFRQPGARDGVAVGDEDITHRPAREGNAGLVELWAPVEPEATDEVQPWMPPVERKRGDSPPARLAALVAKRIAKMIGTGEPLESHGRAIRAGDIMVLVRRRTGFVEDLVRHLKTLKVPVAGVDRMVLTDQMAVMDLMALGEFLLLPEDDLTLATVLKGPLVGLTEDELFTLAHGRGDKRLWDVLSAHAGSASRFGTAHAVLGDLLAKTDYLTPVELYGHVLVACEGRKKLLARLGLDAEDPIDEFMSLALSYQDDHAPSLQGFLHWLSAGDAEIKRDLDSSGSDAVRVITVHGAKGLQAPIVFLPDTMQTPTFQDRLLWTSGEKPLMLWCAAATEIDPATKAVRQSLADAQDREYRRLLYVAMTRAEDRLYVCGWQNRRPRGGAPTWYDLIKAGLAASMSETVTDAFLEEDGTLGSAEVLRLTSPQAKPAQPKIKRAAPGPSFDLPAWTHHDAPPEAIPPRPLAPSRVAMDDPPVNSPLNDTRTRFQRGIIIHRLLQSLPDLPPAKRRKAAEAFAARPSWQLEDAERAALVDETMAVLETPDFVPLFAPETSRAEVPVTGLLGKFALSGQVDRLAVTDDEVWIVDYKTNRPPPHEAINVDKAYVYQMAAYRRALQAIYPKHTVHCLFLWTDGPFILELPAQQMDDLLGSSGLI
ncbi:MAG: double-strand break repair helicase AddA [Rhodospirillaceae bacterium]